VTERSVGRWIARAIVAAGIVALAFEWSDVSAMSGPPERSVWEQIFAAGEVVTAARIALILGCVYLTGTFVALSVEGRWLVRAGPAGAEVESLEDAQIVDEEATTYIEDLGRQVAKFRVDLAAVKDGVSVASDKIVELQDSIDVLFEAMDIQDEDEQ
jgi:hypothetical protein